MTFEYKVVPAPTRGRKARGVKTPADRFARALEEVMNDLADDGWEYLRTDTLPSEERHGLAGRTTVYQNMLVFRREIETDDDGAAETEHVSVPVLAAPAPEKAPEKASAEPPVSRPASKPAAAPEAPKAPAESSLDTMISQELAAARAPRLPSAGPSREDPGTPVKAPAIGSARPGLAAE